MYRLVCVICGLLLASCSEPESTDVAPVQQDTQKPKNQVEAVAQQLAEAQVKMITATVRYIDLEGGFYGLVTADGERYLPTNLAEEYQTDGTVLVFKAKPVTDRVSIQQWGTMVELYQVKANLIAQDSEL